MGTFVTVRRRLKVLVANLLSVSVNKDFLRSGGEQPSGSIAVFISAASSASSMFAISVARLDVLTDDEQRFGAKDARLR